MLNYVFPLLLGFFGSLHCIGMCGPIALALPIHQFNSLKRNVAIILYNLGRSISYVILGLIFGSIGQLFVLSGLQQVLSIIAGVFILGWVLTKYTSLLKFSSFKPITLFMNRIKFQLSNSIQQKSLRFLFLTGVLNGFLPCGLVYIAIAAAANQGNTLNAMLFMFLFGISTWPVMTVLPVIGSFLSTKFKLIINRSLPFVLTIMGFLMIMRGLNLGIPYLSPKFNSNSNKMECCQTTPIPHSRIICKPN